MRVLVCGGRDFQDARQMYSWLDGLLPRPTLIQGGAFGADAIAARAALSPLTAKENKP